jgi:hypothetical protein
MISTRQGKTTTLTPNYDTSYPYLFLRERTKAQKTYRYLARIQHTRQRALLCTRNRQAIHALDFNPHAAVGAVVARQRLSIISKTFLVCTLSLYTNKKTSGSEEKLTGFQLSGPWSPLAWLTLSVTAMSCGFVRSLANACRREVVQLAAPD